MTASDQPPTRAARLRISPPVFYPSAALTLLFVLAGTVFPGQAKAVVDGLRATVVHDFGWFYIAAVAGFLVFVLYLALGRHGSVRLGPDDSEPDYSYLSWFAMLFSAGMGVGLMFFGVAEPLHHYAYPPTGEGDTVASAQLAMVIAFFHWGVHAWAICLVIGLALAYFSFRRGLPCTVRSALQPLIGDRIDGPIGHAVDVFAVLGTIFGVATTLGLGVLQADAGIGRLIGTGTSAAMQMLVVALVVGIAALSVLAGMDRGIKRLSELNVVLALALMVFILLAGSPAFLLNALVQNVGAYLEAVVPRTLRTYAYAPNPWLTNWTLFYWGWGIAWSPFVGMFIARISRGRTIREFVLGVLLVPAVITFLWLTVFGNTAISMDRDGLAPLAQMIGDDAMAEALFAMLDRLPLATVTTVVATALVLSYLVTTADSGALVIDTITSGDAEDAPVWQRVFWVAASGAIAAMLLLAGGLDAIQTAVTVIALPFAVVMVLVCWGTLRALRVEEQGGQLDLSQSASLPSWQRRLGTIMRFHRKEEVAGFLSDIAVPALEAVAAQIRATGLEPQVTAEDGSPELQIRHGDGSTFRYRIRVRGYLAPSFAWAERRPAGLQPHHYRAMAQSTGGEQAHDVTGYTRDQILHELLDRYAHFRMRQQSRSA